jgi:uncharacterized protein YegP (UPF0339 family)
MGPTGRPFGPLAESFTMSRATFEVYEDREGKWRWRLVHDNGNIIADSGEGYASRQKCEQGLESVKQNAPGADVVELDDPPEE